MTINGRRGVDCHRDGDFFQIDAVEELLHIVDGIDRDTETAHFAKGFLVVAIQPHERGEIECGAETGQSFVEQESKPFVGLLGGSEAGKLPHRP